MAINTLPWCATPLQRMYHAMNAMMGCSTQSSPPLADFFSSFWNQFGPNCTSFLVAAEVYPTDARQGMQGSPHFGRSRVVEYTGHATTNT